MKKIKTFFVASTVGIGLVVPTVTYLTSETISYKTPVSKNLEYTSSSYTDGGYANLYTLKYSQIKNMPLTKINWFGSHDSGTYGIFNRGLGVDGSQEGFVKFAQSVGLGTAAAKLGQMQTESVYSQLEDGVRYLDLRLSNSGSSYNSVNDIYITHSFLYASFVDIVKQINSFIKENPNEIVFIDINHWYPSDKNNGRMQKIILDYLVSVFGDKIAKRSQYSLSDPYWKFINPNNVSGNKNIVLFFSGSKFYDDHVFNSVNSDNINTCKTNAAQGNNLISYWTGENIYDKNEIIKRLNQFLEIKKQYPNNLYVVQAIPNWDAWQTFSGLAQRATGYSMDSWWSIGKSVSNYFTSTWYTTDSKYIGVILMANDITSKIFDITYKIRWSISNTYSKYL